LKKAFRKGESNVVLDRHCICGLAILLEQLEVSCSAMPDPKIRRSQSLIRLEGQWPSFWSRQEKVMIPPWWNVWVGEEGIYPPVLVCLDFSWGHRWPWGKIPNCSS